MHERIGSDMMEVGVRLPACIANSAGQTWHNALAWEEQSFAVA